MAEIARQMRRVVERAHRDFGAAEERFRLLVESIPDYAIVMLDGRGFVTSWNAGAERIRGWRAEEIVGRHFSALYTPEDAAANKPGQALATALEKGRYEDEGWRVRKDGSRFYAHVTITPLRERGVVCGFAKVTRDMTAQWKAEQRQRLYDDVTRVLSGLLEDYEAMLSALTHLVVRTYADFGVLDLVEEGGRMRRVEVAHADPRDADLARQLSAFPPDRSRFPMTLQVLRTGKATMRSTLAPGELEAEAIDDEHRRIVHEIAPRSMIVAPIIAHARTLGLLTLVVSRSARVYDEDDLRLTVDLCARVGMLLDNARLYRSAREAIKARDEVLAVVAHDLRNPLGSIGLRAQALLLKLRADGSEVGRALASIRDAVKRMDDLIADLLDVTRMEAGHVVQERRKCVPGDIVAQAIETARPTAEAKALALEAKIEQGLPLVDVDSDRVLQVLSNLIGNAIKFTSSGGRIEVRAARSDGSISFAVTDTGTGIAAEEIPHLFDRYWQARRVDRRGLGLGLSICKLIVTAHGGTMSVESTVGRGSTFRFTLPTEKPRP
jgi:PAS domain S-box-containing protein